MKIIVRNGKELFDALAGRREMMAKRGAPRIARYEPTKLRHYPDRRPIYGPFKQIKPRNSWVNGDPLAPDECDDHCQAFGGNHAAPTPKAVLIEAFKSNHRSDDPERLAAKALTAAWKAIRLPNGKYDMAEFDEHLSVAVMAAVEGRGKTTYQAIACYHNHEFPGPDGDYVFGCDAHIVGIETIDGRRTVNRLYANLDRDGKVGESRDYVGETEQFYSDNLDDPYDMVTHTHGITQRLDYDDTREVDGNNPATGALDLRDVRSIEFGSEEPDDLLPVIVANMIADQLGLHLAEVRKLDPDAVEAFEFLYLGPNFPGAKRQRASRREVAKWIGMSKDAIKTRADRAVRPYLFEAWADFLCPAPKPKVRHHHSVKGFSGAPVCEVKPDEWPESQRASLPIGPGCAVEGDRVSQWLMVPGQHGRAVRTECAFTGDVL